MKAVPARVAGYVGILPGWQAARAGWSCATCGRAFRGKDRLIRWSATGGFWAWHHWCDMPAEAVAAAERQEELARPGRERWQAFLEDLARCIGEREVRHVSGRDAPRHAERGRTHGLVGESPS